MATIMNTTNDALRGLAVVEALHSCSAVTVWRGVKSGRIPSPRKLLPGITCWNVGELRAALSLDVKTRRAQP